MTVTDPDTVRAPDAAFVSQARLESMGDIPGYWPGAPDLVVEVVSPNDKSSEVLDKALDWLGAGCRMGTARTHREQYLDRYRQQDRWTARRREKIPAEDAHIRR